MLNFVPRGDNGAKVDEIDFLFEVGTLRHVQRSWRQFGGLPFANVAEHSFRTAMVAMVIALREKARVEHVVQLALIHDLPETRTGDANYVNRMYRSDDVETAWGEIECTLTAGSHLRELREELEAMETLEAKIVKDADRLECDFELREMTDAGANIASMLDETREAVRRSFYTETAKQMFSVVQGRSSHHWHLNARNRLTAGDWGR